MNQVIYPKKIIKVNGIENPEALLLKQELQIDLYEPCLAKTGSKSYIILDFGKEMLGGIRILAFSSDQNPVRIRFGESVGECCSELGKGEEYSGKTVARTIDEKTIRQNSTNDHALRDLYITLPSWSDTPIGDTGFRFVRLDFSGKCELKSVVCINTILSKKAKYIYRGDKQTEKIFKAAKRTVDLCAARGFIWDGVKRDRLVWAGDLTPEIIAISVLYGRTKEVENTLEFAKLHAPLPRWMNNFPTYSLWWAISLQDYLKRTGAEDFVIRQLDYLEELSKQFYNHVNEFGDFKFPAYFLDWKNANRPDDVKEGFRAIAVMGGRATAELLEKYGRDPYFAKIFIQRAKKKEVVAKCPTVAALKYFATGSISENERNILIKEGADGMSTFLGYYILTAIASFDKTLSEKVMKEYFGAMLSLGSTTFWEHFEMNWTEGSPINKIPTESKLCSHGDFGEHCYIGYRKSLCHGWSAGVIGYIYENL